jgi:hypothetical protein
MRKKRKPGKKAAAARRPRTKKARRRARRATGKRTARRGRTGGDVNSVGLPNAPAGLTDASPVLTGGDVDADWRRAASTGEEAVGGSVATPDQDRVDDIGRALGVERSSTAPVVTSDEVLRDRDQRRWELERRAERRRGRT